MYYNNKKNKKQKQKKKGWIEENTSPRRPCAPGPAPVWEGHIPITYYTPKDNKSLIWINNSNK